MDRGDVDCELEILTIYKSIDTTLSNLDAWTADVPVETPLSNALSKSMIHQDPLGVVLIIGAWNFPVFTCFEPMVSAIAAGNCVLMKPSETSPNSSAVIRKMIEAMDQRFFRVIEGGPDIGKHLTTLRFDLIAFTGGS